MCNLDFKGSFSVVIVSLKTGCNEKQNRYNFVEEKLQFWKTEIVSKSGHDPKKEKTCSGVNQFRLLRSYKILL